MLPRGSRYERYDTTTASFVVPPFVDDDGTPLAVTIAQDCGCTVTSCAPSTRYDGYDLLVSGTAEQIDDLAADLNLDPETVDGQPYVEPPTCPRCGRLL
jgi:hypothetical protein